VQTPLKETPTPLIFAAILAACILALGAVPATAAGQMPEPANRNTAGPPPSSVGVFPLSQVRRGQRGTAWTVFEGTTPEPMDVEILGVLRGAIGPGKDMILAKLHGEKPEFTGVVAGMSGSPVYVEGKLLGALSYRIGQFTKEPIAGITPIEQMLEVRDLPEPAGLEFASASPKTFSAPFGQGDGQSTFAAMETPLLMSGFDPQAVQLWKSRMAGTGLDIVSAGGPMGSGGSAESDEVQGDSTATEPVVPGSAVSLQLVRGDLEIAATCTVTYVDPEQLLACGHPVLQSGPVSLPMTTADVVATLASPLNSFKIINTGRTIGAFTEDRATAIRGALGARARMIPVLISVNDGTKSAEHRIEVLDLPSLTPSAVLVSIYQILLETNQSTSSMSYHVTGEISLGPGGRRSGADSAAETIPVSAWAAPGETMGAPLAAALAVGDSFNRLYSNASRLQPIQGVKVQIKAIPEDLRTELESVRLISSGIVHAGDTVMVEATVRPWHAGAHNVRLPVTLPSRLEPGNVRVLVSGAAALDRTLDAAQQSSRPPTLDAASARLLAQHDGGQLYVSLLLPETQASEDGVTLQGLPLSMANTMEPQRSGSEVGLHGESLVVAANAPAGGLLTGQQILNLHVEAGGGLH
jgi:hypothetical protein